MPGAPRSGSGDAERDTDGDTDGDKPPHLQGKGLLSYRDFARALAMR